MNGFERPKLLTHSVLDHLRSLIVSGDLNLGAALSERQLAERLKVSKTPVREALAQLRNEGLVTIVPQKGAYVFTLSAREVVEICEFRLALEGAALRISLERGRTGLVETIEAVVSDMEKARTTGDGRGYLQLDTAFHEAFFRHCGNHYLRESYDRFVGKIAALRTHLAVKPMHTKLSFDEHKTMLEIFRSGTVEQALDVLADHIGRTRETYAVEVDDIALADRMSTAS